MKTRTKIVVLVSLFVVPVDHCAVAEWKLRLGMPTKDMIEVEA